MTLFKSSSFPLIAGNIGFQAKLVYTKSSAGLTSSSQRRYFLAFLPEFYSRWNPFLDLLFVFQGHRELDLEGRMKKSPAYCRALCEHTDYQNTAHVLSASLNWEPSVFHPVPYSLSYRHPRKAVTLSKASWLNLLWSSELSPKRANVLAL